MFFTLSPDLSLYILSFVPVQDVVKLYTLSHSVARFLRSHEDALFHQLAVLHGYAKSGVSLDEAVAVELRKGGYHVKGVKTWMELCECSA